MPAAVLPWSISIIVSIVVSWLDLATGRKKALYASACYPILARLSYDVASAIIVLSPLKLIPAHPFTLASVGLAVTGGLLGPLLLRTKASFSIRGKQLSFSALGMLRRLQEKADRQIDDLCAVGESNWIRDKVLPTVINLGLEEAADWSIQALRNLERSANEQRSIAKAIATVEAQKTDAKSPKEGLQLIVQVLCEHGGHKLVDGLARRSQSVMPSTNSNTSNQISPR